MSKHIEKREVEVIRCDFCGKEIDTAGAYWKCDYCKKDICTEHLTFTADEEECCCVECYPKRYPGRLNQ